MFDNISKNEIVYLLPEDGEAAKKDFLSLFDLPDIKEVYICAYNFSMPELMEKLKKLDSQDVPVHILVDYVQARGPSAWNCVVDLYKTFKNSSIVLTTAGINSKIPGAIWHYKVATIRLNDNTCVNFEGSINFSSTGWVQGNSARRFESELWSNNLVQLFQVHQQFALSHYKNKQIGYLLSNPIQAEELDYDESTIELQDQIAVLREANHKLIDWMYIITAIGLLELLVLCVR